MIIKFSGNGVCDGHLLLPTPTKQKSFGYFYVSFQGFPPGWHEINELRIQENWKRILLTRRMSLWNTWIFLWHQVLCLKLALLSFSTKCKWNIDEVAPYRTFRTAAWKLQTLSVCHRTQRTCAFCVTEKIVLLMSLIKRIIKYQLLVWNKAESSIEHFKEK